MGQPVYLEKMTSVQERGCPVQKNQASKTPTGPSSNRSNNRKHKNPLESNKPGPSKAPARPSQAPSPTPQNLGANRYN